VRGNQSTCSGCSSSVPLMCGDMELSSLCLMGRTWHLLIRTPASPPSPAIRPRQGQRPKVHPHLLHGSQVLPDVPGNSQEVTWLGPPLVTPKVTQLVTTLWQDLHKSQPTQGCTVPRGDAGSPQGDFWAAMVFVETRVRLGPPFPLGLVLTATGTRQ
jgi:hypothetical protein